MTERVFKTPAGVLLGPLELIDDGAARNFVLEINGAYFHGFVVRQGEAVFGYVDSCPHAGLFLAETLDDYLTDDGDYIMCDHHGALFQIKDGLCVGGPCAGKRLSPWAVEVTEGQIFTA